jgi:hypothetical protein
MMKNVHVILLNVFINFISVNYLAAQENIKITGRVESKHTKEHLSFASVNVQGKPFGTVANPDGEFDFYIPAQYIHDTLVVSHLGYESFRYKISDLKKEALLISLNTTSRLLGEVIINEEKLSGKEIVARAIKQLKINYSTEQYGLEGFFREIEEENGKYVLLTEAAITLHDKDFDGKRKKLLQESVEIKEMRRSLRYSGQGNRDNIGYALADLIENNDIRYCRGMLDTMVTSYSLDTITSYDNRSVYGISTSNQDDRGMMYVDMETLGILKISMERKSRNENKKYYYDSNAGDSLRLGRTWFRFSVEFEPYGNKLYARRMHESELNELYNPKTGRIKIISVETLEFIITQVHPGIENKKAKRLRYGLALKTGEYHAAFWRNYNTLKLTPVNNALIRDLEKEISLEEQFKSQK